MNRNVIANLKYAFYDITFNRNCLIMSGEKPKGHDFHIFVDDLLTILNLHLLTKKTLIKRFCVKTFNAARFYKERKIIQRFVHVLKKNQFTHIFATYWK